MPPTNLDDRPMLAPAVENLLGTLRRRIRQYIWLEGCAAAIAWLGVAFWATLAADWFFEPSATVRIAMLAVVAGVLATLIGRLIGRRIFVHITDSNAATLLERRFPQLNDSLLTAVVLSDRLAAAGTTDRLAAAGTADRLAAAGTADRLAAAGTAAWSIPGADVPSAAKRHDTIPVTDELSREMLAHTCREAANRIGEIELRKVFNPRPLWLHCSAATLLSISVVFFAALFPPAFGVWASRVLAMSNNLWPRNTHLQVVGFDNGTKKVARGSDLEVVVRADTDMPCVPEVVEIRYRTEGGGRGRATMDRRGVAHAPEDRYQEYAYTFHSILADLQFDVLGGDDRVYDRRIQAVDSPVIPPMTLECELPGYIGRKQPPMPAMGVMSIPMGSRVTVHADQANKDIVSVQVSSVVGDRPGVSKMLRDRDLSDDRRGFSYSLSSPVTADTTLLFTLTDSDEIQSRDPVRLMLVPTPDQPPQVAVQLDGIGTAITPQARVAVAGRVADDYGVGRVWFERAIDQQEPKMRVIAELPKAPAVYNLVGEGLEVRELGLKPGQKLLVTVKASDLCDLGHGPNAAAGERWLLDVVTPEQLRAMLEARELVLRQRFEQLMQEMTETRDLLSRMKFESDKPSVSPRPLGEGQGVRAPDARANGPHPNPLPKGEGTAEKKGEGTAEKKGKLVEPGEETEPVDSPARQRDLRFLRVQGALTNCRKGAPEVSAIAESFDDICKQLVNNRIDTEELKKRLKGGIADPLHAVAEKMFPELDRRLEELQSLLEDAKKAPALRDNAQQQAEEILLAMRKIRDRMIELEDFNEAVELLRNIVETQKKLHDQTEQRHKEKIRNLLKE
jgi:hypothetical protein